MENARSRPAFRITDDLNDNYELSSNSGVAYEWYEAGEDEVERETKIQELMQRIRSWIRLSRNEK